MCLREKSGGESDMENTIYDSVIFGKRLKELRKVNDMTQEELAVKLLVSVDVLVNMKTVM